MQLIIPMSGRGTRYKNAGYSKPKPLIEVNGAPMIERLLAVFPVEWQPVFIIAENHTTSGLIELLNSLRPRCQIKIVPEHDKGPGHAIYLARDLIDANEPTFVSYCDYGMVWDAHSFERFVRTTECDACLVSYRGFHPHYLNPGTYAYSRLEGDQVIEVREKGSFTSNREDEFASCGAYYFKSGKTLLSALDFQIKRQLILNGELYTSLTVQALIQSAPKAQVRVFEIKQFFQWGTPRDLQDFEYWEKTFKAYVRLIPVTFSTEQLLMPMAGLGSRMKPISSLPKPLIPVHGTQMFRTARSTLPQAQENVFVTVKELKESIEFSERAGEKWVYLDQTPSGQALSVEAGLSSIDLTKPVLVSACDHGIVLDQKYWNTLVHDSKADAAIMTIRGYPLADQHPQNYAYISESGDTPLPKVMSVSVKVPLSDRPSRDALLVGTFWFRS